MAQATQDSFADVGRRFLALLIDILMVGIFGCFIIALFYDSLLVMRSLAVFIGLVINTLYFTVLDSRLGKGQTVGKRLFHLQVVDHGGEPLHPGKALVRCLAYEWWFFLESADLPPATTSHVYAGFRLLVSAIVLGWPASQLYLAIANRRTHQLLHDLASDSFVRRKKVRWIPPRLAVNRRHYPVVGFIFLASLLGEALVMAYLGTMPAGAEMAELTQMQTILAAQPGVLHARVFKNRVNYTGPAGAGTEQILRVNVEYDRVLPGRDKSVAYLAAQVLSMDPHIAGASRLAVQLSCGVDMVVASSYRRYNDLGTPEEWKAKIRAVDNYK